MLRVIEVAHCMAGGTLEGSHYWVPQFSRCASDLLLCISCRRWERHPECGRTYFMMAEVDSLPFPS